MSTILWADDEIDLLKPHIIFLKNKGYEVIPAVSGNEAIELLESNVIDIIFLDENMPGLSGIETLKYIKTTHPHTPVVMITKSEEEHIMEDAIGSNIADYLIKPVNPNQILLCLKKNIENSKIQNEKNTMAYQQAFRDIAFKISDSRTIKEWEIVYKELVYWELELDKIEDSGVSGILSDQKEEANSQFSKFIINNYEDWISGRKDEKPLFSHTILKEKLFPNITESGTAFLFVIDNLRYDQWKTIQTYIHPYYRTDEETLYYSILPTATHYARNAMFAGLMPSEIAKKYPQYWLNENDEGGKNQYEQQLLEEYLKRFGKPSKTSYSKILNLDFGKKIRDNLHSMLNNPLNVVVFNFVDMLSHARTDVDIIRELADDEKSYRNVTATWFANSVMLDMIRFLAEKKVPIFITTDHGTIKIEKPIKIIGDRQTNSNLRYKVGRNLDCNSRDIFEIKSPEKIYLPKENLTSSFVFTTGNSFLAYPNNYSHYVNYYKNTFQHGGISMEEMMIPFVKLLPR
ncbi:MAG: bifunctional response regulator/alkaline phosphatase family protein [Bacteroidales bacterium]|nr:bifunctional response regulator/alkaline phosphatase family protein [Bacteroidales bacterium]